MKNKTLPYCICIFLAGAGVDVRAATVTPAYKLGGSYASDSSTTAKCLEGHAGSTLGNPECRDMSDGCKSNSECVSRFGDGWVCGKGRDGNAKRGVCKYQECSGTGDTSCSTKYSHLRSCVKNEIGVFECRITCNWQKIKEAGKAYIGSMNIADRMKFEYNLWNNFSSTAIDPNYMTKRMLVADYWYTCENGKVAKCARNSLDTPVSALEWDNGKNDGIKYRPCLPCSIASGGTWGVQDEESPSKIGSRAYSAVSSSKINRTIRQPLYVESTGTALLNMNVDGCANETALKSTNIFTQLNNTTAFLRSTGHWAGSERFGLSGAVEIGTSPICFAWHTNPNFRYVLSEYSDCPYPCLGTTILAPMVYIPKQIATRSFPVAHTATDGRVYATHNFNQQNGTLLCCAIGSTDSSVEGNKIKHCIVVKY